LVRARHGFNSHREHMNRLTDEERLEVHALLHLFWTKDVGSEGYLKEKWSRLQALLEKGLGPVPKSVKGKG
jgi:hypothetical protein